MHRKISTTESNFWPDKKKTLILNTSSNCGGGITGNWKLTILLVEYCIFSLGLKVEYFIGDYNRHDITINPTYLSLSTQHIQSHYLFIIAIDEGQKCWYNN